MKLSRRWVSPGEILDDVVALIHPKADEAGVTLRIEADDAPPCWIDGEQIKTCLMNIVVNAFQSMAGSGTLRIAMDVDRSEPTVPYVRMVFTDTGTGIASEDLALVFQPYFTTKKLGIGLGLALTKRIIEEHGGSIGIESRPGEGTAVTVLILVGSEEGT
jgi:signal transduction histidine kinase